MSLFNSLDADFTDDADSLIYIPDGVILSALSAKSASEE